MSIPSVAASTVRRIPFHRPSIGEEEIAEVVDTLRSGWLTTGPKVKRFEQDFASYVGSAHAVAFNSGTAALHLALEAIGLASGDEVIIPTNTFTATGEVVTYFRARPVLADIRPDTFNLDAEMIAPLITSRTKAIIPVHVAGQACDMDPILELARAREIQVIEDAAHALPATYRGRTIGTIGDMTAFSFYATKTVTTGEGGMLTTEREEYAQRVKQMSLHGLSGDAWRRYSDKGSWYYEVTDFGFKYNLTDVAASLGIHQLKRADALCKRRREIADVYHGAFANLDTCVPPLAAAYGSHAWHLYVLRLNLPALTVDRGGFIDLLRDEGIGTSVHFIPLHLHPAYRRAGWADGEFPNADAVYASAVSLPIYPRMTDPDIDRVAETVRRVLRSLKR